MATKPSQSKEPNNLPALASALNIVTTALTNENTNKTLNRATAFTSNVFTLAKIAKHINISRQYFGNESQKFQSVADALAAAQSLPDSILISFANLGLYAVYTPAEYAAFCNKTGNSFEQIQENTDADPYKGLNVYQIVLTGTRQKLVFASDNSEYFEELQKLAAECFKTTARRDKNQISVSVPTTDESDLFKKFDLLAAYVDMHGGPEMRETMRTVQVDRNGENQFRQYHMVEIFKLATDNLAVIMEHVQSMPVQITITNSPGCTVVTGTNASNTVVSQPSSFSPIAYEFIKANPPGKTETKHQYYNRFITTTGTDENDITKTSFGKNLGLAGYKECSITGGAKGWRK